MDDGCTESAEPPGRSSSARQPQRGPRVQIQDEGGWLSVVDRRWVASRARQALAILGAGGEVRVRVVDAPAMAQANRKYAHRSGPTDVLAFDMREADQPQHRLDADVLVCAEVGQREAARRGHTLARELVLYVLHGALHCLGYDDGRPHRARQMHELEDALLERIGVGATYARRRRRAVAASGGRRGL